MDAIKDTANEARINRNRQLAHALVEAGLKECPDELDELLETGALDKWLHEDGQLKGGDNMEDKFGWFTGTPDETPEEMDDERAAGWLYPGDEGYDDLRNCD